MKNHFFPFLEIFSFRNSLLACFQRKTCFGGLSLSEGQLPVIHGQTKSVTGRVYRQFFYFFLPSPLSHRFTVRSRFSAWLYLLLWRTKTKEKLTEKKTPKNQLPRTLFGSTTRETAVMHDGQYQPRPLSSLETRISSNLLRLREFFFGGTYFGLNCSKITLKNSFFFYRRFWKSV